MEAKLRRLSEVYRSLMVWFLFWKLGKGLDELSICVVIAEADREVLIAILDY